MSLIYEKSDILCQRCGIPLFRLQPPPRFGPIFLFLSLVSQSRRWSLLFNGREDWTPCSRRHGNVHKKWHIILLLIIVLPLHRASFIKLRSQTSTKERTELCFPNSELLLQVEAYFSLSSGFQSAMGALIEPKWTASVSLGLGVEEGRDILEE